MDVNVLFKSTALMFILLLVAVVASGQTTSEPKKVALLVGIRQYDKPGFEELPGAENDATALRAELLKLGFQVHLVLGSGKGDDRATLENLRKRLATVTKPLSKNDILVVALAGHGQQLETTDGQGTTRIEDYFCPVGAVSGEPETMLPLDELLSQISGNVGRGLVLVDACRDEPDDPNRVVPGRRVRIRSRGIQGRQILIPSGMSVLFSCAERQRAFEHPTERHGLFTFCLLQEFRAAQGTIEWLRLAVGVTERMESDEIAKLIPKGRRQTPVLVSNVSRVSLGRVADRSAPKKVDLAKPKMAEKEPDKTKTPVPISSSTEPVVMTAEKIGLKFVRIPAGEFLMGSPDSVGEKTERPQHKVKISRPFAMSAHEITVKQFAAFVNATGYRTETETSSHWKDGDPYWLKPGFHQADDHPATYVSWLDAKRFCEWLTLEDGIECRLPTDAEWEYACRAGTKSAWWFGDDPMELMRTANVADTALKQAASAMTEDPKWGYRVVWQEKADKQPWTDGHAFTSPVGSFRANAFGLFDMHGNVDEWCADAGYSEYAAGAVVDPIAKNGFSYPLRGGSWATASDDARSASRSFGDARVSSASRGFRIVRASDAPNKEAMKERLTAAPPPSITVTPDPDAPAQWNALLEKSKPFQAAWERRLEFKRLRAKVAERAKAKSVRNVAALAELVRTLDLPAEFRSEVETRVRIACEAVDLAWADLNTMGASDPSVYAWNVDSLVETLVRAGRDAEAKTLAVRQFEQRKMKVQQERSEENLRSLAYSAYSLYRANATAQIPEVNSLLPAQPMKRFDSDTKPAKLSEVVYEAAYYWHVKSGRFDEAEATLKRITDPSVGSENEQAMARRLGVKAAFERAGRAAKYPALNQRWVLKTAIGQARYDPSQLPVIEEIYWQLPRDRFHSVEYEEPNAAAIASAYLEHGDVAKAERALRLEAGTPKEPVTVYDADLVLLRAAPVRANPAIARKLLPLVEARISKIEDSSLSRNQLRANAMIDVAQYLARLGETERARQTLAEAVRILDAVPVAIAEYQVKSKRAFEAREREPANIPWAKIARVFFELHEVERGVRTLDQAKYFRYHGFAQQFDEEAPLPALVRLYEIVESRMALEKPDERDWKYTYFNATTALGLDEKLKSMLSKRIEQGADSNLAHTKLVTFAWEEIKRLPPTKQERRSLALDLSSDLLRDLGVE